MVARTPPPAPTYLGDGVYARWDGYHVVLSLDAQPIGNHVCIIALEPPVLDALNRYIASIAAAHKRRNGGA